MPAGAAGFEVNFDPPRRETLAGDGRVEHGVLLCGKVRW